MDPFRQTGVAVRTKHVDIVPANRRQRVAFGDFQTPPELAEQLCRRLGNECPRTIVEPTCGEGSILAAAVRRFPNANRAIAFDISARHAATARRRISEIQTGVNCQTRTDDFFQIDWHSILASCAEPILIVGNPPWVTNAALGRLESGNHPRKENRQGLAGIEALTGQKQFRRLRMDDFAAARSRRRPAGDARHAVQNGRGSQSLGQRLEERLAAGIVRNSADRCIQTLRCPGRCLPARVPPWLPSPREGMSGFRRFFERTTRTTIRSLRRTPGRRSPGSQPHSTPDRRRISLAIRRQTRLCRCLRIAAGGHGPPQRAR